MSVPETNAPKNPVDPKPAASVVLVREALPGSPEPLEVYMIRRNRNMRFLGGYYAFPGGKVDLASDPVHRAFFPRPDADRQGAAALHRGDVGGVLDLPWRRLPALPVG